MPSIIRVEGLSKKYIIGHKHGATYDTLRDAITQRGAAFARRLVHPFTNGKTGDYGTEYEECWALRDINFEVREGERLGIIGRNGAGKSTLLKILSRITDPTVGRIAIGGRVASLLEVGTGFHPELSGRENIFLNGAVLGMSKAEIERKFGEIVDFAEVERFLDTPVKHYSSGMYVRLAFAIAAHLQPDILIVDEVLAVGDLRFQKKCLGKLGTVSQEGRTVIFVSHNMAAIRTLCTKGLVLDKGELVFSGTADQCVSSYEAQNADAIGAVWQREDRPEKRSLALVRISATIHGKQPRLRLELEVELKSSSLHKPAFLAVDVVDSGGSALLQAIPEFEGYLMASEPRHHVKVDVDLPPLIPGTYLISVWVGSHNSETLDEAKEVVAFEVHDSPAPGRTFPHTKDHGFVVPSSNVSIHD